MKHTAPMLLTLLLLAGCASYDEQRVSSDPVFRETSYVFPPDQTYDMLDMEERVSLQHALSGIPRDSLKKAVISTNLPSIAYSEKVRDLQVFLVDNGFDADMITVSVDHDPNPLSLYVRYKFFPLPEKCPNWHSTGTFNQDDYLSSHLGCANVLNLTAMVADPSDLVKGKSSNQHGSETSVPAIQRYYNGDAPVAAAANAPSDSGSSETTGGN
ncbi:MAG: CpaD family pilus assembly lipoprotein [Rickettsiales bacterium]